MRCARRHDACEARADSLDGFAEGGGDAPLAFFGKVEEYGGGYCCELLLVICL